MPHTTSEEATAGFVASFSTTLRHFTHVHLTQQCAISHFVISHSTVLCHLISQESEDIAFNKDASKGPVFKPAKTDYKDTFLLGSKNSKQRSQYDTGQSCACTCTCA